ncbi:protein phosphatase 2C domain-containing protein [Tumidithrix elongata RA019]|uniref:Protein phosphatase 2C domain-containing protein n=1 Tax=Tumidithrix elongata BACA0141 TaxID=2716417 RepID=A0AAW9QA05_9CYAN|nr:protein phosphatase 2C domain-containing protein [Tumidithrix elongata RA019]
MNSAFELAVGSVIGRNHLQVGKNNQDAYHTLRSEFGTIAVVCDGCGSGKHSEVGAKIGAKLTVQAIAAQLNRQATKGEDEIGESFWLTVQADLLLQLRNMLEAIGGLSGDIRKDSQAESAFFSIINDYFLFTIVGVLITPKESITFAIGDGAIALNGEISEFSFPNNAPPYLAYGLYRPDLVPFQLHHHLATENLNSVLIGTDGVSDLIQAESKLLPNGKEVVGNIAQFWQQDRYFSNPDMLHRRLALMNHEVTKPDWQNQRLVKSAGLLPDDTTLVAIRRSKAKILSERL